MWDPSAGRLLRRYRQGDAAIDGYAEDYAFLIFGLIELFQASGDAAWLSWARELQARQDELFWDAAGGGYFSTTGKDPTVLLRMKEDYDGAEPSPTSVSALNLLALAHLTGEAAYADRAARGDRVLWRAAGGDRTGRAVDGGRASTALSGGEQIVVVGRAGAADTTALWHAAHRRFRPFAVALLVDPEQRDALAGTCPGSRR